MYSHLMNFVSAKKRYWHLIRDATEYFKGHFVIPQGQIRQADEQDGRNSEFFDHGFMAILF